MLPKNPRILLCNDDGIDAPGLLLLERVAKHFSDDIWVVAPAFEQSAASRALSIRDPLRIDRRDERHIAVYGTPTDSVMMGVLELVTGKRPDLILSGVNKGQNLAEHVTLSGTIAAAIQGMEMGIPSIALSQTYPFTEDSVIHWETAEYHAVPVLKKLFSAKWPEDVLINVNFPDCKPEDVVETQITRIGRRDADLIEIHKRKDPGGREYHWLGFNGRMSSPPEGTDLHSIYQNRISISPLHMDLTHYKTLAALNAAFGG
jgi:5'-nucleotidase